MTKPKISIEEMMEAGMHFGHQTHRRNPKMDPYIFDARNGVHIIDLTKAEPLLKKAVDFVEKTASEGKQIILVGTKRQAAPIIKDHGEECGMPYVNERWLGGLLTNFKTIRKRLDYLRKLDDKYKRNDFSGTTKKEKVTLDKQYQSLIASLGGLRSLEGLPGTVFVVDVIKDKIAVLEARKLGIPVVAMVDTNVNPGLVDYPIPANDDAKKSIEYVVGLIADVCKTVSKKETSQKEGASEEPVGEEVAAGSNRGKPKEKK